MAESYKKQTRFSIVIAAKKQHYVLLDASCGIKMGSVLV